MIFFEIMILDIKSMAFKGFRNRLNIDITSGQLVILYFLINEKTFFYIPLLYSICHLAIFRNFIYNMEKRSLTILAENTLPRILPNNQPRHNVRSKGSLTQYEGLNNISKNNYNQSQQKISNKSKLNKSSSISTILKQVRNEMTCHLKNKTILFSKKKEYQTSRRNQQKFMKKMQKKLYANYQSQKLQKKQATKQDQLQLAKNESLFKFTKSKQTVQVQHINTLEKPPHRFKTALSYDSVMDKFYMYGGIGCEMDIKMAEYNIDSKKWRFPPQEQFAQYHPTTPISGHTFACFRGKGFIYGGSSTDLLNQLSIVDLKSYKFSEGDKCLYRRKDHAAVMVSKYMFIHGGIEANMTTNNLYYYDTQQNIWGYFSSGRSALLPYLSHHSMVTTFHPGKIRKKRTSQKGTCSLIDISQACLYIFGGKNKKGQSSDKLYCVKIQGHDSLKIDQIVTNQRDEYGSLIAPCKRFSCCFQLIQNDKILLFGGRQTQQEQYLQLEANKYSRKASKNEKTISFNCFNDIYTFNTESNEWTKQKTSGQQIESRYGMASVGLPMNSKVYIFGGFNEDKYADANITVLNY